MLVVANLQVGLGDIPEFDLISKVQLPLTKMAVLKGELLSIGPPPFPISSFPSPYPPSLLRVYLQYRSISLLQIVTLLARGPGRERIMRILSVGCAWPHHCLMG